MKNILLSALVTLCISPAAVFAATDSVYDNLPATKPDFSGRVTKTIKCVNNVIYVKIGAPSNNAYLWSLKVTKMHTSNRPSSWKVGDLITGTAGPKYFCIQQVLPLITHPAYLMQTVDSVVTKKTIVAPKKATEKPAF